MQSVCFEGGVLELWRCLILSSSLTITHQSSLSYQEPINLAELNYQSDYPDIRCLLQNFVLLFLHSLLLSHPGFLDSIGRDKGIVGLLRLFRGSFLYYNSLG